MYMEIWFVQKVDLTNKSFKQFLVKNENGAISKKFILYFYFQLKFIVFFRFLNIVSLDWSQNSHSFYKKKLQSLN